MLINFERLTLINSPGDQLTHSPTVKHCETNCIKKSTPQIYNVWYTDKRNNQLTYRKEKISMLEFDLIDAVAGRMVMDMYAAIRSDHAHAMIKEGLTESGADEATRLAIEKIYKAMKEVDNE